AGTEAAQPRSGAAVAEHGDLGAREHEAAAGGAGGARAEHAQFSFGFRRQAFTVFFAVARTARSATGGPSGFGSAPAFGSDVGEAVGGGDFARSARGDYGDVDG